ncbi:STAS domain-containing protein [Nocardia stercoris]|uniref:Anti-sigma factor antagonist n=1 Tax=Nocardia stercoris TaxID=2483361 RepID=A0A3M2L0L9_9NOCA|nr:STAS domain-containing protein [Nocardia stercoris]RMI31232.1 anti-sigma factor antagonist [Nocardia stercoris]
MQSPSADRVVPARPYPAVEPSLSVQRCLFANTIWLVARGSIDASTIGYWQQHIRDAAETALSAGPLVIDMRGVSFVSCRGFEAIAEENERCRDRGVRICLIGCVPRVQRILDVSQLDLDVYPSALAADGVVPQAVGADSGTVCSG